MAPRPIQRPTFAASDRLLARTLVRPFQEFMHREASGGVVLVLATIAALVWANSPWSDSYGDFWHTHVSLEVADWHLEMDLHEVVNDMLMALFFFVVGLEIKQELVVGELRTFRAAALPAMGALGGMVVPALLYLMLNPSGDAAAGWGIPMATDIAFALGVVALVGPRVSARLKLFLLTLAIVDDIGAVTVIALFYTDDLDGPWLLAAIAGVAVVNLMRQQRVWEITPYVLVGTFVWYATFASGVHATIAGVVLGLSAPARPLLHRHRRDVTVTLDDDAEAELVRASAWHISETASVAARLQSFLHPYTSFFIIPVFALANAGIDLGDGAIGDAFGSAPAWGVVVGLVIGKPLGIGLALVFAAKVLGWRLPVGMTPPEMAGIGVAAGIGFTVSLFVAELAWADDAGAELLTEQAKIGVLVASIIAAVVSTVVLRRVADASDEMAIPADPIRPLLEGVSAEPPDR